MTSSPTLTTTLPSGVLTETSLLPDRFTAIGPGTEYGSATGSVGPEGSAGNFYFVQSPDEALANLTFTLELSSGSASLAVYNLAGEILAVSNNPGSLTETLSYTLGLDAGVFIGVFPDGLGEANYTLSLDMEDAGERDFLGGALTLNAEYPDSWTAVPSEPDPDWEWTIFDAAGTVGGERDARDALRFAYADVGVPIGPVVIYLNSSTRGGDGVVSVLDGAGDTVSRHVVEESFAQAWFNAQPGEDYYFQVESAVDGIAIDWSIDGVLPGSGFTPFDTVEGTDVQDLGDDLGTGYDALLSELWNNGISDPPILEASVGFDGDSADTIRFTTPFDGVVNFGIRYADDPLEWAVYNADFDLVGEASRIGGSTLGNLQLPVNAGETFYLQLTNPTLPTYYSLEASFEATGAIIVPPQADDEVLNQADGTWEVIGEAGDYSWIATFLPADSSGAHRVRGALGGQDGAADRDIYRFVPTVDGEWEITLALHEIDQLDPEAAQPLGFRLLNGSGRVIATDEDARSGTLRAALNAGESYFLEFEQTVPETVVRYDVTAVGPVALLANEILSFGSDATVVADAGNSIGDALFTLEPGGLNVRGWINEGTDPADYFRVEAEFSGDIWLKLNGMSADLSLSVWNLDGSLRYESDNADDVEEIIQGSADAGDIFYIGVETSAGAWSPYSLSLGYDRDDDPATAESRSNVAVDRFSADFAAGETLAYAAANDSVNGVPIGDAGDLGLPVRLDLDALGDAFASGSAGLDTGNGPDTDVYFVTSPVSGWAELALYGLSDDLNINVYGEGDVRGRGLEPGTLAETLRFPVMRGGTYFIEVLADDGAVSDYELFVDFALQETDYLLIDSNDDGLLYDADILADDGLLVSAFALQTFRTYAGSLNRTPDNEGFAWWLDQREQGNHTLDSMAAGFNFSAEFLDNFPGAERPDDISSADFVNYMYNNVFGRPADPGGFEFYTTAIDSGDRSQAQVIVEMTQSNEYVLQTALSAIGFLEELFYPLGA